MDSLIKHVLDNGVFAGVGGSDFLDPAKQYLLEQNIATVKIKDIFHKVVRIKEGKCLYIIRLTSQDRENYFVLFELSKNKSGYNSKILGHKKEG